MPSPRSVRRTPAAPHTGTRLPHASVAHFDMIYFNLSVAGVPLFKADRGAPPVMGLLPIYVCEILRKDTLHHYSVLNSTMAFSRRPCTTRKFPWARGILPSRYPWADVPPPISGKQQRRGPPTWPKVAEGTSVWQDHVGRVGVARRRSSDSRES